MVLTLDGIKSLIAPGVIGVDSVFLHDNVENLIDGNITFLGLPSSLLELRNSCEKWAESAEVLLVMHTGRASKICWTRTSTSSGEDGVFEGKSFFDFRRNIILNFESFGSQTMGLVLLKEILSNVWSGLWLRVFIFGVWILR
jgi:hypothetical protein